MPGKIILRVSTHEERNEKVPKRDEIPFLYYILGTQKENDFKTRSLIGPNRRSKYLSLALNFNWHKSYSKALKHTSTIYTYI